MYRPGGSSAVERHRALDGGARVPVVEVGVDERIAAALVEPDPIEPVRRGLGERDLDRLADVVAPSACRASAARRARAPRTARGRARHRRRRSARRRRGRRRARRSRRSGNAVGGGARRRALRVDHVGDRIAAAGHDAHPLPCASGRVIGHVELVADARPASEPATPSPAACPASRRTSRPPHGGPTPTDAPRCPHPGPSRSPTSSLAVAAAGPGRPDLVDTVLGGVAARVPARVGTGTPGGPREPRVGRPGRGARRATRRRSPSLASSRVTGQATGKRIWGRSPTVASVQSSCDGELRSPTMNVGMPASARP